MPVIHREIRKRGLFGQFFKWSFVLFNALMLMWLLAYWAQLGDAANGASSDAEKAGLAIGATLGTGMLVFFWVAGDVILGLFTLMTRGQRILVVEEEAARPSARGTRPPALPPETRPGH